MNPNGQIAVVTGAGSGLGEATARALAAKGAKVAIFDLSLERAEKVAADIGGVAVRCDVSSDESGCRRLRRGRSQARRRRASWSTAPASPSA